MSRTDRAGACKEDQEHGEERKTGAKSRLQSASLDTGKREKVTKSSKPCKDKEKTTVAKSGKCNARDADRPSSQ